MTTHRYEIEIIARDAANNEHREHLELASAGTAGDTLEKAAKGAASILAGNQNGGFGHFDRINQEG